MPHRVRIAVAPGLRAAAEAARRSLAGAGGPAVATLELVAPASADARQNRDEERLVLERRRARGWGAVEVEAALRDACLRTALMGLTGAAEAVLLDDPPGEAGALLEPAPGFTLTGLWLGSAPAGGGDFAWIEAAPGEEAARVGARMESAARFLELRLAREGVAAEPVTVRLIADPAEQGAQAALPRLRPTLCARAHAAEVDLYGGWFFRNGELQAAAFLAAVGARMEGMPDGGERSRPQRQKHWPVILAPALATSAMARAVLGAGGSWTGRLLAGAETSAACLAADAPAEQWRATLAALARLAG